MNEYSNDDEILAALDNFEKETNREFGNLGADLDRVQSRLHSFGDNLEVLIRDISAIGEVEKNGNASNRNPKNSVPKFENTVRNTEVSEEIVGPFEVTKNELPKQPKPKNTSKSAEKVNVIESTSGQPESFANELQSKFAKMKTGNIIEKQKKISPQSASEKPKSNPPTVNISSASGSTQEIKQKLNSIFGNQKAPSAPTSPEAPKPNVSFKKAPAPPPPMSPGLAATPPGSAPPGSAPPPPPGSAPPPPGSAPSPPPPPFLPTSDVGNEKGPPKNVALLNSITSFNKSWLRKVGDNQTAKVDPIFESLRKTIEERGKRLKDDEDVDDVSEHGDFSD